MNPLTVLREGSNPLLVISTLKIMPPENNPSGAQAGETHVISPAAQENVGSGTPSADSISLEELNTFLGKNFTSKDLALKSIKDTNSYVGMKKEDMEKEINTRNANNVDNQALAKQIEEMRKDNFYRDNPAYATPEIRSFIEKMGSNPSEVVADVNFKAVFEKVKGYDETQKLRTVLDSNPRLATSRDALTKASEAIAGGARIEQVESSIADAVLATLQ